MVLSKELHAPTEVQMGEASLLPYASIHPSAWKEYSPKLAGT